MPFQAHLQSSTAAPATTTWGSFHQSQSTHNMQGCGPGMASSLEPAGNPPPGKSRSEQHSHDRVSPSSVMKQSGITGCGTVPEDSNQHRSNSTWSGMKWGRSQGLAIPASHKPACFGSDIMRINMFMTFPWTTRSGNHPNFSIPKDSPLCVDGQLLHVCQLALGLRFQLHDQRRHY